MNIGDNIKQLRAEKGITQEQLAEHLSITHQSVSKWENNVTSPDLHLIPAIAEYFDVSIDDLFKVRMCGYSTKASRLLAVFEFTQRKEDFDKADAEFKKLIDSEDVDEEDFRFYGTLNHIYSKILAKKAEDLIRQSIAVGSEVADANLAFLLNDIGRNQENIDLYEDLVKNDPNNSRNWHMLSISYCNSKQYDKALEAIQKGLEKFPMHDNLLHQCGVVYKELKQYDQAFDCWKKSYEQDPESNLSCPYCMALAYTELGEYEKAIEAWETFIAGCERIGLYEDTRRAKQEMLKLKLLIDGSE